MPGRSPVVLPQDLPSCKIQSPRTLKMRTKDSTKTARRLFALIDTAARVSLGPNGLGAGMR